MITSRSPIGTVHQIEIKIWILGAGVVGGCFQPIEQRTVRESSQRSSANKATARRVDGAVTCAKFDRRLQPISGMLLERYFVMRTKSEAAASDIEKGPVEEASEGPGSGPVARRPEKASKCNYYSVARFEFLVGLDAKVFFRVRHNLSAIRDLCRGFIYGT
jgi:hypothetical protein